MSFITEEEKKISDEFISDGFVIRKVANFDLLEKIRSEIFLIMNGRPHSSNEEIQNYFDQAHNFIEINTLNEKRVSLIAQINSKPWIRQAYYELGKHYLDLLVGNEVSMQLRINLSIQLPEDKSSLLPLHCDTWSGDSPFEVVLWIPLVNCYDTKSMYILSTEKSKELYDNFDRYMEADSEQLHLQIKDSVRFFKIDYGEILIFNQAIPHGNRINEVNETRWSMNCRFKSIFSPYGDKKLGEFFEPINLKAASKMGMSYHQPKISRD